MQEMWELSSNMDPAHRRYTVHPHQSGSAAMNPGTDDLHAWSIYRQNLNSDFTDSALGSEERSPLPYGNFQLREQTVQSILRHPRLAPRSELANNMYAYLKFGLPRVFPPGGPTKSFKDTASDIHALDSASNRPHTVSRARSETDLVNGGGGGHGPGPGHSAHGHPMGLISNRFRKPGGSNMNKAISESNLLNGGSDHHINHHGHPPRPMSKAGSQASLVSRNSRHHHHQQHHNHNNHLHTGHTNRGYVDDSEDSPLFEFPHLQVRGLGYDLGKGKARILDGISFDLHGGEFLAILATNGYEATTLLDILAGRTAGRGGRVYGEFTLNGNPVSIDCLGSRVGYVRKDYRLHKSISVEQTLAFHYLLRSKDLSTQYLSTKISVLLEELGLGSVRKSLVSTLTSSERQRLVVACQLITGAEILLLDDATHGMDIFDTFFLVEYLRQWANSDPGRIVVITIHPPTYEIFSMFSKVALMSTGRLMFYGHRKEMLPYFAFIEYPCPAFKNPSDYYLDLVTLDNLSSEALLESSQRVETLADSYRRKQEQISDQIGPPQPLPPRIKNAGFLRQFYTLLLSWIVYKFPWNIVDWMLMLLVATSTSITVGALYWNMRLTHLQDQNNASDRMGLHWVLMSLLAGPAIIMVSSKDTKDLDCVTRDFEEKLYSKAVYFIAKNLVELPYMLSIYLGYIIPAYVMAGISSLEENSAEHFYMFIGYMLLYLHVLRIIFQALTYLFRSPTAALTIFAVLFFLNSMVSFYTIHTLDLGSWVSWIKYISPTSWIYQRVVHAEFIDIKQFTCPRNPTTQESLIVTLLDCRIDNGNRTLDFYGFNAGSQEPLLIQLLSVAGIGFVFYLIGFFSFILRRQGVAVPPIETP